MGINFHETIMGKQFFQGTFPSLVRSLEKKNELLETQNELLKEILEETKKRDDIMEQKMDSLIETIKWIR